MTPNEHTVTVSLTPGQFAALEQLAQAEKSDLPKLVNRSVDTLLAIYHAPTSSGQFAIIEKQLTSFHQQILKLLVTLMKLVGQAIYFASLPVTTGPVKARLNDEGITLHWLQSEKFAIDLLKPPDVIQPQPVHTANLH